MQTLNCTVKVQRSETESNLVVLLVSLIDHKKFCDFKSFGQNVIIFLFQIT